MDDNTNVQAQSAPVAPAAPAAPSMVKVRCITDLKPWANVTEADGGSSLRPLDLDEVVSVPTAEGNILQAHRHAIIVG